MPTVYILLTGRVPIGCLGAGSPWRWRKKLTSKTLRSSDYYRAALKYQHFTFYRLIRITCFENFIFPHCSVFWSIMQQWLSADPYGITTGLITPSRFLLRPTRCVFSAVLMRIALYCARCGVVMLRWTLGITEAPTALKGPTFRPFTCLHCLLHLTMANILVICFALLLLANVNSSSCSLYVIVRPSVVCRLSVTLVHPTQAIEIFGNVSGARSHNKRMRLGWQLYKLQLTR